MAVYDTVKKVVDAVFALPPDVVTEYEVAVFGFFVTALNLNISAGQKASDLAFVTSIYLAAKAIVAAAEKLQAGKA